MATTADPDVDDSVDGRSEKTRRKETIMRASEMTDRKNASRGMSFANDAIMGNYRGRVPRQHWECVLYTCMGMGSTAIQRKMHEKGATLQQITVETMGLV